MSKERSIADMALTPWGVGVRQQTSAEMVAIGDATDWVIAYAFTQQDAELIVKAVNSYEVMREIKARHDEKAKACNFSGCGCEYCAALSEENPEVSRLDRNPIFSDNA